MNFEIIFENSDLLAINKPPGVNSDDFELRAHRLDKDTSGVLLIAKNEKTRDFLQEQFKNRKTKKKYLALVVGHLRDKEGSIETLLGRAPKDRRKQKVYFGESSSEQGKREAKTNYRVLQSFKDYDLMEAEPVTGRKHQIRAHFQHLGHPIAGDKLYGFKNQPCPKGLSRQFLHAFSLKIAIPGEGEKEFATDLPADLKEILDNLEKTQE